MKRLEIFANQSVQEELVAALEAAVAGLRYTVVPDVHGRGGDDWKLGTTVWPEENFLLVCYLTDDTVSAATDAVRQVKVRYPKEGLKAYTSEATEEA
jgi:hypothetical protein